MVDADLATARHMRHGHPFRSRLHAILENSKS